MTRLPVSPPAAVVTQSQEEEKFLASSFGSFSQLDIPNPVWIDVAYFHLGPEFRTFGFQKCKLLEPLKQSLYGDNQLETGFSLKILASNPPTNSETVEDVIPLN